MCLHRLADDPTGLVCTRDHDGAGHVYESSTASWLGDRHDRVGAQDE